MLFLPMGHPLVVIRAPHISSFKCIDMQNMQQQTLIIMIKQKSAANYKHIRIIELFKFDVAFFS